MVTSTATDRAVFEPDLLVRLTDRWSGRVWVKKDELDLDGHFDPGAPDFPESLVPILGLPRARRLDRDARDRMLSAAWIAYNAKTQALETEIILPACRLLLADRLPVRTDDMATAALHQTCIDEHYHILMCHNAVGVTRRRRGLVNLDFDPGTWSVVRGLHDRRAGLTGTERDLVDLAFGLAAETTISGFLSTLAASHDIQPMNRITTDLHRRDESGHAVIFRELVGATYRELDRAGRELFEDALVSGIHAFRSPDTESWVRIGTVGGLSVDPAELDTGGPPPARDTAPLQQLLGDLDLLAKLGPALGLEPIRKA